ncbi:kinase-like domain-containing protein [Trichoderma aethiopicum]
MFMFEIVHLARFNLRRAFADSHPSSMDGTNRDRRTFGPLLDITDKSLIRLASRIANDSLKTTTGSGGKLLARIDGSYNIVHIVEVESTKLVIRVPCTGWGSGMTPIAAQAMESQVATMRLIRNKTNIPVPEIYAFDTTADNEIGAPFLCMSFLPGRTVSQLWFDDSGALPLEELRLRILTSVSQAMTQLSCLEFDTMGAIMEDESGAVVVGPLYDCDEQEDGSIKYTSSGPFRSTSAFLKDKYVTLKQDNVWGKAKAKVMEAIIGCRPTFDSPPGFVLCPPDFDSQNVLADDQGTVTGFIDWDFVHTMPWSMGFARYPGWITRDWDPLMYGWPHMADSEDSPETLQRYRAHYNAEMGKALQWQGDWKLTEKSHITEAVWIAMLHPMNRMEICRKFVQVALGDDIKALDVLYEIGADEFGEEDWETLMTNLKRLIC